MMSLTGIVENDYDGGDADFGKFIQLPPGNPSRTQEEGTKLENIYKNRFNDIIADDSTRVKLSGDRYINANYVFTCKDAISYIATQCPMENTIGDFWEMILQERVSIIVNLNSIQDLIMGRSYDYYSSRSQEDGKVYEDEKITVISTTISDSESNETMTTSSPELSHFINVFKYKVYDHRDNIITNDEGDRLSSSTPHNVVLIKVGCWSDFGVLDKDHLEKLVGLYQSFVDEIGRSGLKVVVHCSAGIGRTGSFILANLLLSKEIKNMGMSPMNLLLFLRKRRKGMISTYLQYRSIVDFVRERERNDIVTFSSADRCPLLSSPSSSEHISQDNIH